MVEADALGAVEALGAVGEADALAIGATTTPLSGASAEPEEEGDAVGTDTCGATVGPPAARASHVGRRFV